MTLTAALGYLFIGSIVGFVAGVYVAISTPVFRAEWENYRKQKEARAGANRSL